jgi:uncharacterized protein YjbJ (UPF0337 family)
MTNWFCTKLAEDMSVAAGNEGASMKDSTKDKAKGTLREAKGAVKEKVGHTLNKPHLEAEGHAEKVRGKTQKRDGEVEKAAGH